MALRSNLLAIVVGTAEGPEADARIRYYRKVTGCDPARSGPIDDELIVLAQVVMRTFGHLSPKTLRSRLGALRVEAASRVRAAAASAQPNLRSGTGEVETDTVRPSHAGFFGLDVHRLRYRRFDGAMSPWVTREVFVSGDAVTVLPYDPVRDRVLLIEQMRMGPVGRGDPLPWQLEAIAGRIDPGETPEAAARREAMEEAFLVIGRLEKVAEYYSSPGAVSEYLYSYVALCDLPDGVAGVFGAEEEAENIRGHLLPFDALMTALTAGALTNAPLILTALWLERERARLRAVSESACL